MSKLKNTWINLWVLGVSLILLTSALAQIVQADPLDSITMDPNAEIALRQNTAVTAGQSKCSAAYAKTSGMLSIDFAVEPSGSQIGMLVLNTQQVNQLNQGQNFTGEPLLKLMISGVASQTVLLPDSGQYWVCFVNTGNSEVDLEVRAEFRSTE
ncbi:MAG: hypothetical protein KGK44_11100 [Gammaproteobacteria bacterium]|nr:hypothetical protein [Gammaproteobacteria bacterium]